MATKPSPGASDGVYGTELNAFLDVSLADDGKILDGAAQSTSAAPTADAELANKKYVDDEVITPASVTTTTFVSAGTFLRLPTSTELTISSSAITVTQSNHTVDTQSDASTDDLATISGGTEGDLLILRAESSARTIVLKDATGNIVLAGDFSLNNINDVIMMYRGPTFWIELSRSNNAV